MAKGSSIGIILIICAFCCVVSVVSAVAVYFTNVACSWFDLGFGSECVESTDTGGDSGLSGTPGGGSPSPRTPSTGSPSPRTPSTITPSPRTISPGSPSPRSPITIVPSSPSPATLPGIYCTDTVPVCAGNQYLTGSCDPYTGADTRACTPCPPSSSCNGVTATPCSQLKCSVGEYINGSCSIFSDTRRCKSCPSSYYCPDGVNAVPCSGDPVCSGGSQVTGSCTATGDTRACTSRPTCTGGTLRDAAGATCSSTTCGTPGTILKTYVGPFDNTPCTQPADVQVECASTNCPGCITSGQPVSGSVSVSEPVAHAVPKNYSASDSEAKSKCCSGLATITTQTFKGTIRIGYTQTSEGTCN